MIPCAFILVALQLICALGQRRNPQLHSLGKEDGLPLRGLLAILVILGHLMAELGCGEWSPGSSAVAVFFFISGYGLMQKRKISGGGEFQKAVVKLLPKFFVASVVYAVFVLLSGHEIHLWQNIVRGSSSLPIPFTWYIPAIMSLYAIFYGSNRLCRTDERLLVCVAIGLTAYWILLALVFQWPYYWWKSVGGFLAGMVFATYEENVRQWVRERPATVYLIAMCLLIGVFACQHQRFFVLRFAADHVYFAVLGPILALILMRFPLPRLCLSSLGRISYEIYIVHGAFVIWLRTFISNDSLYAVAVFICAVAFGKALSLFALERTVSRRCTDDGENGKIYRSTTEG